MTPAIEGLLQDLKTHGFSVYTDPDGLVWAFHPTYGGGWVDPFKRQVDKGFLSAVCRLADVARVALARNIRGQG